MSDVKITPDRLVLKGSLRFELRDVGDEKQLLFLGTHWQTGAEVILRVLDVEDAAYFSPGPLDPRQHGAEWQLADDAGAGLYDPAANPPNRIGYTTSPASYDHDCTVELERFTCPAYASDRETEWRKVLVRGGTGFSEGQVWRYFVFTDEDPRVVQAAFRARQEVEAARQAEARRLAAEDTARLEAMTLDDLEAEGRRRATPVEWSDDEHIARGRCSTILARRRQEALDAAWAALKARIPVGVTMLIPARPAVPRVTQDKWLQHLGLKEPARAAYLIEITGIAYCARTTPLHQRLCSVVYDDHGESHTDAETVAQWAERGYVTTAYPSVEMRRAYYARTRSSIINAPRAVVAGKTYYIGRPLFGGKLLVLDEGMHMCRSKKTADLVARAHRWHESRNAAIRHIAYVESGVRQDWLPNLPRLRAELTKYEAEQPADIAAVQYTVPAIPSLTLAEVQALSPQTEEDE